MHKIILLLLLVISTIQCFDFESRVPHLPCPAAGFYANPTVCSSFYRCVDFGYREYAVFQFNCPNGLVFDEQYSVCNWNYAARTSCNGHRQRQKASLRLIPKSPAMQRSHRSRVTNPKPNIAQKFPNRRINPFIQKRKNRVDKNNKKVVPRISKSVSINGKKHTTPMSTRVQVTQKVKVQQTPSFNHKKPLKSPALRVKWNKMKAKKTNEKIPETKREREPIQNKDEHPNLKPTKTMKQKAQAKKLSSQNAKLRKEYSDYRLNSLPSKEICEKPGFFRNKENCHKFYRCVQLTNKFGSFQIFHFNCPSGLAFDELTETCNWPYNTQPCDNSYTAENKHSKTVFNKDKQQKQNDDSNGFDEQNIQQKTDYESNEDSSQKLTTQKINDDSKFAAKPMRKISMNEQTFQENGDSDKLNEQSIQQKMEDSDKSDEHIMQQKQDDSDGFDDDSYTTQSQTSSDPLSSIMSSETTTLTMQQEVVQQKMEDSDKPDEQIMQQKRDDSDGFEDDYSDSAQSPASSDSFTSEKNSETTLTTSSLATEALTSTEVSTSTEIQLSQTDEETTEETDRTASTLESAAFTDISSVITSTEKSTKETDSTQQTSSLSTVETETQSMTQTVSENITSQTESTVTDYSSTIQQTTLTTNSDITLSTEDQDMSKMTADDGNTSNKPDIVPENVSSITPTTDASTVTTDADDEEAEEDKVDIESGGK